MPKCDFNKVALQLIEITLRHGCSSVNFQYIFRTPLPKSTSGTCFGCWERHVRKNKPLNVLTITGRDLFNGMEFFIIV